jgi:hypothetical protein
MAHCIADIASAAAAVTPAIPNFPICTACHSSQPGAPRESEDIENSQELTKSGFAGPGLEAEHSGPRVICDLLFASASVPILGQQELGAPTISEAKRDQSACVGLYQPLLSSDA